MVTDTMRSGMCRTILVPNAPCRMDSASVNTRRPPWWPPAQFFKTTSVTGQPSTFNLQRVVRTLVWQLRTTLWGLSSPRRRAKIYVYRCLYKEFLIFECRYRCVRNDCDILECRYVCFHHDSAVLECNYLFFCEGSGTPECISCLFQ